MASNTGSASVTIFSPLDLSAKSNIPFVISLPSSESAAMALMPSSLLNGITFASFVF
jgi:hypothetical protein